MFALENSLDHELVLFSDTAAETRRLGAALARLLAPGDLLCLFGELGAGKTTFVQGLASGLGSEEPATSPSFTLIHEHPGPIPLYHLDLYRLGPGDLAEAGVEEALRAPAIAAVEWAERLPRELRRDALEIEIAFGAQPDARRLLFRASGRRSSHLISHFEATVHADSVHRNRD